MTSNKIEPEFKEDSTKIKIDIWPANIVDRLPVM